MKYKDMHRSDWKRVLKKKYASRDFTLNGLRGKESILQIEEVSQPLTISNAAGCVKIADQGISWLQIAIEHQHVWCTVMYDPHDLFIQAYFDITDGNCFDHPDNPAFIDLYLDVVLNKDLQLHILDKNELDEALQAGLITKETYDKACIHCENLISYLKNNTHEFLDYCRASFLYLKTQLK